MSRVTCPWYRGVLGTEVSISGETPTSQEAARSRSQAPSQCVAGYGNTPVTWKAKVSTSAVKLSGGFHNRLYNHGKGPY